MNLEKFKNATKRNSIYDEEVSDDWSNNITKQSEIDDNNDDTENEETLNESLDNDDPIEDSNIDDFEDDMEGFYEEDNDSIDYDEIENRDDESSDIDIENRDDDSNKEMPSYDYNQLNNITDKINEEENINEKEEYQDKKIRVYYDKDKTKETSEKKEEVNPEEVKYEDFMKVTGNRDKTDERNFLYLLDNKLKEIEELRSDYLNYHESINYVNNKKNELNNRKLNLNKDIIDLINISRKNSSEIEEFDVKIDRYKTDSMKLGKVIESAKKKLELCLNELNTIEEKKNKIVDVDKENREKINELDNELKNIDKEISDIEEKNISNKERFEEIENRLKELKLR